MLMGARLRVQILLSAIMLYILLYYTITFVSQSFDNIHGTHKTD